MRNDFYTFAKASSNTWEGYVPGCVTTFAGEAAKAMDEWNNFVHRFNKKNPDLLIDRTDYFNYMISEVW